MIPSLEEGLMQYILPYACSCIPVQRKYMAANKPGGHHNGTTIRAHDCRLLIQSQLEMDILGVRHGVRGVLRPSSILAGDICGCDPSQTSAEVAEGDERCKYFRTHRAGEEGVETGHYGVLGQANPYDLHRAPRHLHMHLPGF